MYVPLQDNFRLADITAIYNTVECCYNIPWYNITWYCSNHCRDCDRICMLVWTRKRHPITRSKGPAMGCLLTWFWKKLLYNANALCVEEFNLFLLYNQRNIKQDILMVMTVQMYSSSSLITFYKTNVNNFLCIFAYKNRFPNETNKTNGFIVWCTVKMFIIMNKWFICLLLWLFWLRTGCYSFTLLYSPVYAYVSGQWPI